MLKKWSIYFLSIVAMLASDMMVKRWAVEELKSGAEIPVVGNLLTLSYAENTGAAFSMLQGKRWFFIVLTIIVLSLLIYAMLSHLISSPIGEWGCVLILGGALGNFFDRLFQGYVVDMFSLRYFAIFNVADVFVTAGAILLSIYLVFFYSKEERSNGTENI